MAIQNMRQRFTRESPPASFCGLQLICHGLAPGEVRSLRAKVENDPSMFAGSGLGLHVLRSIPYPPPALLSHWGVGVVSAADCLSRVPVWQSVLLGYSQWKAPASDCVNE